MNQRNALSSSDVAHCWTRLNNKHLPCFVSLSIFCYCFDCLVLVLIKFLLHSYYCWIEQEVQNSYVHIWTLWVIFSPMEIYHEFRLSRDIRYSRILCYSDSLTVIDLVLKDYNIFHCYTTITVNIQDMVKMN
jgi:hypothetical protein